MTQNPPCIPTFDPVQQAGFIRSQLVAALSPTEELEGAFVVSGKLVVPVATAECWRMSLDGVVAGMKSLREQNASLAAEVARLEADNAGLRGMARELAGSL